MSNILVVTPVPTHPPDAGNRARIKTLLHALTTAGHQIVVLHVQREHGDADAMATAFKERYVPIRYTAPATPWRKRVRRWLQRLGSATNLPLGFTYKLDEWWDESVSQQVQAAVRAFDIDTVLANYVFFSKALVNLPTGVLKVLDTHDSFADRHKRLLAAGLQPAWFSCTTKDERTGIERADVVIAIQKAEADYFRSITTRTVITVGHLVDSPDIPADIPSNHRLVTIGSRNTINVESTRWLAMEVFPLVLKRVPDATLAIVGGVCADLGELQSVSGIFLQGRVDDVADEYRRANLVVNPMLSGTGLKIKSIEALGYGCALVTTPAGAQGLQTGANQEFLKLVDQVETPDAMASSIIELLENPSRARELGAAGHAFARSYNAECLTSLSSVLARQTEHTDA